MESATYTMIGTFQLRNEKALSVQAQIRRFGRVESIWWIIVLSVTSLLSYGLITGVSIPYILAWICFCLCIGAIVYHPRNGVYSIVALSLLGDPVLTSWYPFNKNFSSQESLLFFNRSFSFTPLEICLALTFGLWFLRMAFQHRWEFCRSPLLLPVGFFTACAAFGMANGLGHHGDRVMALWESRAIFYIFPLFLLVSSLITTRAHVNILLWAIALPIAIDGLLGLSFVINTLKFQLSGVESIGDHSLSIYFNGFFIILLASWIFRGSWSKRLILSLFAGPVLISYVANNRRAAFISLGIALLIFALVLYRRYRTRFWLIVPPLAMLAVAYTLVFWNAGGVLGAPAKAIRSVVGKPDPRDASSNEYRVNENINLIYTIKAAPLLGLGFGQKFYRVVPLADISSIFPFYEYITHNSILWIWVNMGVCGFIGLFWMISTAIASGARVLWHMPNNDMSVAALFALCYIMMHFIFAYVDMSWSGPNMVLVSTAMGLIACLTQVVAYQPPRTPKRWPWQRVPQPLLSITPVYGKE